ncbi:50S ribosomal protein L11 methyltransferase [Selenomonas sputigena]|uniref:Ribosomal protein L11 methyltransferase n=1 Tax=Selenomonas sputigena (strain ATCC 35185 / DSM 20758 / CCUG 44933 / VPI D19B-28) TaxID=546271 RepID=C9LX84_SELS3|nr:50S ribosomal protein L11 methyltransferase [Selenomonas sputigena]EEX76561.1 ribosomal protein L11 methyltransferase [Selenomonas sputigena ATCC 35185]
MRKERCFLQWAEVSVDTSHEATDLVSEILQELGAAGVVIEDPALLNEYIRSGLWDYTDLKESEETEVVRVKAYWALDEELEGKLQNLSERLASLAQHGIDKGAGAVSWKAVADEDWAETWKEFFHTEKIGARTVIKPTWEEYEAEAGEIVAELDPGAAFGTGQHATTSLCIRALEDLVRPGMTVFDVGTGSGVLAIVAAKLGAKRVEAVDFDPVAVRVARENVRQNGAEDVVRTERSDLLKSVAGEADLIIANIIADIIVRLFGEVKGSLAAGGTMLLSGIIEDRLADVVEAAVRHGFSVAKIEQEKGWAAVIVKGGGAR